MVRTQYALDSVDTNWLTQLKQVSVRSEVPTQPVKQLGPGLFGKTQGFITTFTKTLPNCPYPDHSLESYLPNVIPSGPSVPRRILNQNALMFPFKYQECQKERLNLSSHLLHQSQIILTKCQ